MRRVLLVTAMGLVGSLIAIGPSAAAIPSPSRLVTVDGCGAALAKPGGGVWECTFADNFDGTSLDRTKWHPQTNFATGQANAAARSCHVDDPANVAVKDGNLMLTVRKVSTYVFCLGLPAKYTSGQVSTYRKFSQQYGRFEARMKSHPTNGAIPGLQESFWLWPDDRYSTGLWPSAGEIDVAELYSQYNTLAIPFLHYTLFDNWGPRPGLNTAWNCPAARGVYNTYALTWTRTTLTIDVNGRTCLINRSGDPAFQKRYIVAFTAALGMHANALTASTPIPATLAVDYIRVWR